MILFRPHEVSVCRSITLLLGLLGVIPAGGCRPQGTPTPQPSENIAPALADSTSDAPSESVAEAPALPIEPDFRQLTLADFTPFPTDVDTWSEAGGVISSTGKPRGYLVTRDSFQNFVWRLEYRFVRPKNLADESKFKGNTGFLVYVTGEDKLWPVCLEVQGKHVQMGAIKENGGAAAPVVVDHDDARLQARKPVGQWNELEITSTDGALSVALNGVPVATSEPNFLSEGRLGIQAEDHPFEIRRLRIRTGDASAPAAPGAN